MIGEWDDRLNVFWLGANGCEYIAWKGSHQIFVYDCEEYPHPPTQIIQHTNKINSLQHFNDALENGIRSKLYFEEVEKNIHCISTDTRKCKNV